MKDNAHNVRRMLNDKARLDSAALAELYVKYKDNLSADDLLRLWWEVDALRFELAAANERTEQARAERQKSDDRIYQLMARLPGAGGPV